LRKNRASQSSATSRSAARSYGASTGSNSAVVRDKIYRAMGFIEMPEHPRCTVCSHPSRATIEKGAAHGRSLRKLANRYGLTKSAIHRHNHHFHFRFPAFIFPTCISGEVRGNPNKTKPFRWGPGESGNPSGRPPGRKSALSEARELRKMLG
jgi:hypothetical protein